MKALKITYIFSMLATVFTAAAMIHSVTYGNFLHLLYLTPILAVLYPIALIGTAAYLVKKVLQEKSLFEIMQMTGGTSGVGNLLSNPEKEEEKEKEQ